MCPTTLMIFNANFYTLTPFHANTFTHSPFHTLTLLHAHAFTGSRFLRAHSFTPSSFYTITLFTHTRCLTLIHDPSIFDACFFFLRPTFRKFLTLSCKSLHFIERLIFLGRIYLIEACCL